MTQRLLAVLGLSLLACAQSTPAPVASTPASDPPPEGRLSRKVVPLRYRLDLRVDPVEANFEGSVAIDLEITRPLTRFWLHGKNLTVSSAELALASGEKLPATYAQRSDEGAALIALPRQVEAQRATLSIAYRAPFDAGLEGLYRVTESNRWYAFTQFEAISARLCFPGFDEPSFKAPFEVSLEVREGQQALANTPELAREPSRAGWVRVRFAPTPPLPTYLVALAVGPFEVVEGPAIPPFGDRQQPIPLRGIAVAGKGEKLAYALQHTGALLTTLEQMFGLGYPFEKLDLVAVPDFAAGAMENVGLITFREWLLLLDESSPAQQKRAFAYVMAHELAHQWFGNLVTMPWWDDIWLNEAFATWVEYRAVEIWRPAYRAGLAQVEDTFDAFGSDSLVAARQIRQPIETNHDIHNAFDAITYSKGGGVLSMFERYLGPEKFRRGVAHYLEKHRFGTATSDDFLAALSEGSGTDIGPAFSSFLVQPGIRGIL